MAKVKQSALKEVVIEFWLQPYQKFAKLPISKKIYFRVYTHIENDEDIETERDQDFVGDKFLRDTKIVKSIMDDYDWDLNHDWGIISVVAKKHEQKNDFYVEIKSAEELQKEAEVAKELKKEKEILHKFESNLVAFELTKKEVTFSDESQKLEIKVPVLKQPIKISPQIFYDLIKQKTNGVNITLTNSFGENILELVHGDFLNAGLADIMVYKPGVTAEQIEKIGIFGRGDLEEGGIFIRDHGGLSIGDIKRTKYLTINLAALIKELHLKGALLDQQKTIEYIEQLKIETNE